MECVPETVVIIRPAPLSSAEVVAVARNGASVALSAEAEHELEVGRKVVEALAHDAAPHYGVSTGFGALATRHIPPSQRAQLQRSLVRSHAAGTGPEVEREVVRALQLLRLSTLATGRTGVRPETARAYAALLSAGITPVVPEFGSLGCSGDLAPLAACALAVMGEGKVRDAEGVLCPAADALAAAGITPVVLAEKEGLALINGTDGMLGMLVLAAHDLQQLVRIADVAAAMSVEALLGTDAVFAADLQALRPHPGQERSAANLRALLHGSAIMESHRNPDCTRVQDAYSLRCSPQVHGAVRDTLAHAETVAARELAAAIDNPVVLPDGRVESNGNFHGAPLGYVLDFLAIAVADLASISERRTDRSLDMARSARAATVPGRRPRRRLRPHDRPVHAGRDRGRAQAARRARVGRLDPVLGDAGGPRVDGLGGGAQAAPVGGRAGPRARDRAAHGGARPRPAGAADARPGDRCRRRGPARPRHGPRPRPPPRARDRGGGRTSSPPARRWPPPRPAPEPCANHHS